MNIFQHFRSDCKSLSKKTIGTAKDALGQIIETEGVESTFQGILIPLSKVAESSLGGEARVSRMKGDFVCVTDQDVQVAQGDVIYDGSDRYKVEYVYTITGFGNKVSHIELDLLLLK